MSLNDWRRALYAGARLLGHVRAVQTGRLLPRLVNTIIGRIAARILGRMYR